MHFVFTTEESVRRADEIIDFVRGPRLWIPRTDYPDFDDWAQKAHSQLKKEDKRAVVALARDGVAGVVIYQPHRSLRGVLEVKNVSVRPDARGRHVATFLLRNAEIEAAHDYGVHEVLVDAKARNAGIRKYLLANGYRPLWTEDLYGLGAGDDVLFRKTLASSSSR